jgi:hypothetical protein
MLALHILAFPLIFVLPGFFFLRFVVGERRSVALLLSIPFSLPFTSVVAFALAEYGHFSLSLLTLCNTLLLPVLFLIRTRTPNSGGLLPSPTFCLAVFGALIAIFLYYSPPFEYFFGGRDPGIYIVNGIRIAKTGTFTAEDSLIQKIPNTYRILFFEKHNPVRYMGFLMRGQDSTTIVPNFFYLYPIWLSIFLILFGIHGMLYATPFLACCALWMIALFAKYMLDEMGGVSVLLLLGVNAIYLWFARFPNSEFLASYLVFAGIVGVFLYDRKSSLAYGIFGAVCLGLSFYARVDAALMAIPFLLFLGIRWMEGSALKHDLWIAAAYFFVLLLGAAHAFHINPQYLTGTFYNLRFKPNRVALFLAGLGVLIASFLYLGKRIHITERKRAGRVLLILLSGVLLYAYFIRPYYPAENIGSPNAGAFLALGWYFTQIVVILAFAGLVIYAADFRSIHWIFFPTLLIYGILFFYRIRADAEHFWMLRRYLMIICPAIVLLSVYALRRLLERVIGRRSHKLVLLLSAGLACFYLYGNKDLWKHHEFQGSFSFIEGLAKRMNKEDLLLIGSKAANDLHIVGPMLSYYFDRNVLQLRTPNPNLNLLHEFIGSWKGNVYFAGAANSNLASGKFFLKPLEEIYFTTPTFDELYHQRPSKALAKYFQIGWYRVELRSPENPDFIDIGKYDDGSITNFYIKEKYNGVNYRWTDGKGRVFFPEDPRPVTGIVLQLNPGPWVPGMERIHARIYANNLFLVDLKLRNGYNTYEVPVPAGVREKLAGVPVEIRIESKSWVPKRVLNLPDTRRVGVIVDWVKLQRGVVYP